MASFTLAYRRDLVSVLVQKEFKVRYKNTVLGYAWSVLNPLAFAVIFWFVFRKIMRFPEENYFLFLIAGQFPWQFFTNPMNAANNFFLGNSTLIKKVKFPRYFLVLAGVMNDGIHFLATLPVILAIMLYYGKYPGVNWIWGLPLLFAIQFLLVTGLTLILASVNMFFRDLERLTSIFLMMWFYATPVIYPFGYIPQRFLWTLCVNPMSSLMICWRELFIGGFRPGHIPWLFILTSLEWAILIFLFGVTFIYNKLERRFAEVV